jgi:hypothetical protein
MKYLDESGYPRRVTIRRPAGEFSESGDYTGGMTVLEEHMPADIQLSLQIRRMALVNRRGISEDTAWVMFCEPCEALATGDIVEDENSGARFRIDAAGDWGTHVECVLRLLSGKGGQGTP